MGEQHKQTSFAAGEVGPNLHARDNSPQYQQGLHTCRNFIVDRYGSLQRRVGTEFVVALPDPSWTAGESYAPFRLIPFRYQNTADINSDQNYVLVFSVDGNLYVYRDKVLKDTVALPTGWGVAKVIWGLRYAQAGDTIVFASGLPGTATQQLKRTSDTSWAFSDYVMHASTAVAATPGSFAVDDANSAASTAPYTTTTPYVQTARYEWRAASVSALGVESATEADEPIDTPLVVTPGGGCKVALTWTDATDPATAKIRIYRGLTGTRNHGLIGTADAGDLSFIDMGKDADPLERPRWEDAANETVMSNAAAVSVAFFKQRLLWGNILHTGGTYEEMRIIGSALGEFDNFELGWLPLNERDAVDFTPSATDYQRIMHLIPIRFLVALTDSGEWQVANISANATGIQCVQHSKVGSSYITPSVVDSDIMFVQRQQTQLYRIAYSEGVGGLKPIDMSWSARHLTDGKTIQDLTFQRVDDSILWMPRSDGGLLGLTYMPDYGVVGWHRHDTGGYSYVNSTTGTTGPSIDTVCTIPENGYDTTYMVVRRQDNDGSDRTRWMLERLPRQEKGTDDRLYYHLDSWKVYDYRNTATGSLMTLTGGSTWESGETGLTLTASGGHTPFVPGDVGSDVWFDPGGSSGDGPLKMRITAYTSTTIVTVTLFSDIPVAYRSSASSDWGFARKSHTGYHLGNETSASIFADGKPETIKAGPDGEGGFLTTLNHAVFVIGIKITAQVQTLQTPQGRAYVKNVANAEFEVDDVILPDSTGNQSDSGIGIGETVSDGFRTIGRKEDDKDNRLEVRVGSGARKGGAVALQCTDAIPLTIRGITRWASGHGGR